jgi:hypothetical protein
MGVRREISRKPDVQGGLTAPLAAAGREGMDARLAPSHVPGAGLATATLYPLRVILSTVFQAEFCIGPRRESCRVRR